MNNNELMNAKIEFPTRRRKNKRRKKNKSGEREVPFMSNLTQMTGTDAGIDDEGSITRETWSVGIRHMIVTWDPSTTLRTSPFVLFPWLAITVYITRGIRNTNLILTCLGF